jgi:glycosyltransferase involved in cell wall biosynthesis
MEPFDLLNSSSAQAAPLLAVILPANNEAEYIGPCLAAIAAQDRAAGPVLIILAANACRDATIAVARRAEAALVARGWRLVIDDSPLPGKLPALNRAGVIARSEGAEMLVYLDADVICEPALLGQIRTVLARPEPAYATGSLTVARARTWITRAYADLWQRLPFVAGGAVGAGFFAVNAAGRARWGDFPDIISDDMFVRLQFSPAERHQVPARYHWPMVEGLSNLIRVRRRQDAGTAEVYRLYPHLHANEGKGDVGARDLVRLALAAPLGFVVYAIIRLAVRMKPPAAEWSRGR